MQIPDLSGPVRCDVLAADTIPQPLAERWRNWQSTRPEWTSPFLAPEFAMAAGHARPDTRVVVLYRDGEFRAVLPFEPGTAGSAEPIAGRLGDVHAVLHAPGWDGDGAQLLAGADLHAWRFRHLAEGQERLGGPAVVHQVRHRFLIDLTNGFAAYVAGRQAAHRSLTKEVGNRSRKLVREHGPLRLVWDDSDPELLTTLMRWKSAQYRRTGAWDVFSAGWPVELVRATSQLRTDHFAGLLTTLRAGDRVVALHYGLRSGPELASWFPVYDPDLAAYSPGKVLLWELVRDAAERGVQRIDLGWGADAYKRRFCTHRAELAAGWMVRPTVRGRGWAAAYGAEHRVRHSSAWAKVRSTRDTARRMRS